MKNVNARVMLLQQSDSCAKCVTKKKSIDNKDNVFITSTLGFAQSLFAIRASVVIFADSLFFFVLFVSDDDNGSIGRSFSKEADCVIALRTLRRLRPRIWSMRTESLRARKTR